jgi:hypothetical protein
VFVESGGANDLNFHVLSYYALSAGEQSQRAGARAAAAARESLVND